MLKYCKERVNFRLNENYNQHSSISYTNRPYNTRVQNVIENYLKTGRAVEKW